MVMVMWFAWVTWEKFFLKKILKKAAQRPTKVHFFPCKQVNGRNGDHEWLRMINALILCNLVWKVQKSHAANREVSFNWRIFCAWYKEGEVCTQTFIYLTHFHYKNKPFFFFYFFFLFFSKHNINVVYARHNQRSKKLFIQCYQSLKKAQIFRNVKLNLIHYPTLLSIHTLHTHFHVFREDFRA